MFYTFCLILYQYTRWAHLLAAELPWPALLTPDDLTPAVDTLVAARVLAVVVGATTSPALPTVPCVACVVSTPVCVLYALLAPLLTAYATIAQLARRALAPAALSEAAWFTAIHTAITDPAAASLQQRVRVHQKADSGLAPTTTTSEYTASALIVACPTAEVVSRDVVANVVATGQRRGWWQLTKQPMRSWEVTVVEEGNVYIFWLDFVEC